MSEETGQESENGRAIVSVHSMEIAVAVALMAFAAVVIVSNYLLGASWGSDGPESGYFPFYVGIILFISAAAILVQQVVRRVRDGEVFVQHKPLIRIFQILIPTIIYVILIAFAGIYVASAILIACFMVWLGKYRVITAVVISVGFSVALFFTFEVWFLVPLPKGPLETWLGY